LSPVYSELAAALRALARPAQAQLLRRGIAPGDKGGLLDAFDQQMALVGTTPANRRAARASPAAAFGRRLAGAAQAPPGSDWSWAIRP